MNSFRSGRWLPESTQSINIRLLTEPLLFDCNKPAQGAKAMVADAAHQDQMFRSSEWAVFLAMLNDALSQTFADARQRFKLFCRCRVDVDPVGGCWRLAFKIRDRLIRWARG